MEASFSCKTLVNSYQSLRHHILQNRSLIHPRVDVLLSVLPYVFQSLTGTMYKPSHVAEMQ